MPNRESHVMTSSKFFQKRDIFTGQRYRRMEDQKLGPGLACNLGFAKEKGLASLLDVQQLKGQCEASTVCGRQVGRGQLDSKTERSLRCLLAKATW